MKVPFSDLHTQYTSIKQEIDNAIASVIAESAFVRGKYVEAFEVDFAKLVSRNHCVSCANGTDALFIAIKSLGLNPGDEVIVPAHSWISTSEIVTLAGGRVVFCDTNVDTYTIDPEAIKEKITTRTVGIIPVHLYGQAADMEPILHIALHYGLWVIEDCAQAHLAMYKGKQVGSFGDAATYSFYPGKNLGAMGDAGAITTDNSELADKMAMFARHGGLKKGSHNIEGINSRLDGMQAAILSVKLMHIVDWTEKRKQLAKSYKTLFPDDIDIDQPFIAENCDHVWHLYVIRSNQRDHLRAFLDKAGISTVVNYPIALPFLPAYRYLNHDPSEFPRAYANQGRVLSIPLYCEMSQEAQNYVVDSIISFLDLTSKS